ncbi:hypothetical protein [Streptomyces sp. NPDC048269]|uniref:hypothetical protein n=1 Tax=Streptomyces sp. NPDC048269 TaxID=3155753 RepID=UPI003448AF46
MVNQGESSRAEGEFSAHWRVSVVKHTRKTGRPPYERHEAGDLRPLASRDGLRIHGGVRTVSCIDASGHTRWTRHCAGRPNAAHISGGRVLVTTDSLEYTAWGHLGPALLLDLADGTQIAELRGERGAALRGGRFLLGLEGYDSFDTWEHDRDGVLTDSWRSYGHYVIGTGIRVVETDRNVPTSSRVVRLLPGGIVRRGPLLNSPTAPRPLVLEDGTILVLDAGVLRAVDRELGAVVLAQLLPSDPDEASGRTEGLRRDGQYITAVIAAPHPRRPTRHTVHTWTMTLTLHAPTDV